MKFISLVDSINYVLLLPTHGTKVYGYFVSTELVEYFLNQYTVTDFEIVPEDTLTSMLGNPSYSTTGNTGLLTP